MERMHSRTTFVVGAIAASMLIFYAIAVNGAVPDSPIVLTGEPVAPIPSRLELDREKIALGAKLFRERTLSRGGSMACADCHRLNQGGDDGQARSKTSTGDLEDFNTPTVFNCAYNFRLGWLGNYRSLEHYIEVKLTSFHLGKPDWIQVVSRLSAQKNYARAFKHIYGGPIIRKSVSNALSEFIRSLFTPNAPFDRFLRGDTGALTAEEKQGYETFKRYGCAACHQGINIGGNMFQKLGIFGSYYEGRSVKESDLGRYVLTGDERDRYVFRVPSLRNVVLTAPYFHDGSVSNLHDAVSIMANLELGRDIPEQDIQQIIRFLQTLTGDYEGHALTAGQGVQP
jgi:cytochrome c peroxidase